MIGVIMIPIVITVAIMIPISRRVSHITMVMIFTLVVALIIGTMRSFECALKIKTPVNSTIAIVVVTLLYCENFLWAKLLSFCDTQVDFQSG